MSAVSNYASHLRVFLFHIYHILFCILDVGKIAYKPDAGPEETMVFKHYNATEVGLAEIKLYIIKFFVVSPSIVSNILTLS